MEINILTAMDRQIISILIIFLTFITGLIVALHRHSELVKEIKFVGEYLDKFNEFVQTSNSYFDGELYYWLTKKVPKIQKTLGSYGVVEYQSLSSNRIVQNYEIIANTLPQIRTRHANNIEITGCQDALMHYMGYLEEVFESSISHLKNPLKWFQLGVQFFVSLPIRLLYWLGLINKFSLNKIMNAYIFKLGSSIITILGVIGSIIAILQYFDIT